MDDPLRAEQLWMAIVIVIWWLLSVGGEADTPLAITETFGSWQSPAAQETLVDGRHFSARLVLDYRGIA